MRLLANDVLYSSNVVGKLSDIQVANGVSSLKAGEQTIRVNNGYLVALTR
jgi:hypothetical protein